MGWGGACRGLPVVISRMSLLIFVSRGAQAWVGLRLLRTTRVLFGFIACIRTGETHPRRVYTYTFPMNKNSSLSAQAYHGTSHIPRSQDTRERAPRGVCKLRWTPWSVWERSRLGCRRSRGGILICSCVARCLLTSPSSSSHPTTPNASKTSRHIHQV